MRQSIYNELSGIITDEQIKLEEPMKNHTTFRIGGPAEIFVTPGSIGEVRDIIAVCRKQAVPYYVMGNGSNLLVSDRGYEGVIIQIFKEMNEIRIEGDTVAAQAGALLSAIAKWRRDEGCGQGGYAADAGRRDSGRPWRTDGVRIPYQHGSQDRRSHSGSQDTAAKR